MSPSRTTRLSARAGCGALIIATALVCNNPWLAAVIVVTVATLVFGVVLPAVWSATPERQRAALAVLKELRRWFRDDHDVAP